MYNWPLPTLSEILGMSEAERDRLRSPSDPFAREREGWGEDDSVWVARDSEENRPEGVKAEGQWRAAIAALSELLGRKADREGDRSEGRSPRGIVLCGPLPVLEDRRVLADYETWTFSGEPFPGVAWLPSQLLPTGSGEANGTGVGRSARSVLPLLAGDPLAREQFCLVLTSRWSAIVVEGAGGSERPFQFSFDPEAIALGWQVLRSRVLLSGRPEIARELDRAFARFTPVAPDYKLVTTFSQLLLDNLYEQPSEQIETVAVYEGERPSKTIRHPGGAKLVPVGSRMLASAMLQRSRYAIAQWSDGTNARSDGGAEFEGNAISRPTHKSNRNGTAAKVATPASADDSERPGSGTETEAADLELLQAIAHEVRTPLATIRTLTRLLLKRSENFDDRAIARLQAIDRECTEQIDRFEFIFRAVELETSNSGRSPVHLTSTSLDLVLDSCIPRWQKQASRRNLTLDVVVPQKMPPVVSDPNLLERVLTGAIENFTCTLPAGNHVRVEVTLAGHQLKVQLECEPNPDAQTQPWSMPFSSRPTLKSIGQLLMFQPETGNLSLNLNVTKNLFQVLGGKLIVRHRPQQGEVIAMFLPLELG
jgi:hypothetical protein